MADFVPLASTPPACEKKVRRFVPETIDTLLINVPN
jgi:hypothetical protein